MNKILLTGAGFSCNFGGFLSDEIWALIFNNPLIQANVNIRNKLLNDFNFESVYNDILINFPQNDQNIFQNSVIEAFNVQERKIDPNVINDNLFKFIYKIDYFFTLNQDLLIERYTGKNPNYRYKLPHIPAGYPVNSKTLNYYDKHIKIDDDKSNIKPINHSNNKQKYYIKLHGSKNWFNTNDHLMILGKQKSKKISTSPLLNEYKTLFEAITKQKANILIIGYSFKDDHINELLINAIENKSNIYVVDIQSPKDFARSIGAFTNDTPFPRLFHNISLTTKIWYGLSGYFQVKEINDLVDKPYISKQLGRIFN
ncbi:MAG: SIR2 family protein [Candidatus Margulisbacteria bacterium]|nr:SIR2 family protein [Candidatus Margulisiibacteriota bacterium]MBU1617501.1 SIR2 family protein [Candidatus Margulisiibacteriota bacterium]